jgi:hypothetical protein
MLFYFSGIQSVSHRYTDEALKQIDGHGLCFSLHGNYHRGARDWLMRICDLYDTRNMSVLFDSGAFTAWTKGEPPPKASELARSYEYAARLCDPRFREVWFVNLDHMPGVPGRDPTHEETAFANRQSDRNYAELIRALPERILPVLHRCEDPERWNEVQDMSPNYVCLSPLVGTEEDIRIEWSLIAAAHLKARNPATQLHGLATTGDRIMRAVDWRSVDSTAWIVKAKNGDILVEHDDHLLCIPIRRRDGSDHFDHRDERLRAWIVQLVKERGLDLDAMRDDPYARQLFNLWTLAEWSKRPSDPIPRQ